MQGLYRLSAIGVRNLGPGKYADGAGLWLWKRKDGGAQWFFRYTIAGKRREMGIGGARFVSLKAARQEAEKWRSIVACGRDPINERESIKREAAKVRPTVSSVSTACFEARKADLKGDGKAGRWFSPLELHIIPKLGDRAIEDVTQLDIRDALAPIWHAKSETARKAINRLAIVFRHAAAMGLSIDLQATDKAKALLGAQRNKTKHIEAMPWREVPTFVKELDHGGVVELALKFLILTACRSGEVRCATWDEIDLSSKIWTIPAERMKSGREHRVPLSSDSIAVLDQVVRFERDGSVFPSPRKGVLSDMTMSTWMKRHGYAARPHGFRSSFRDWCAETTDTPREVAESCLAHIIGSNVERAYRRTDFLERREILMQRWADHIAGRGSAILMAIPAK